MSELDRATSDDLAQRYHDGLVAENARLRAMIQELIDALMGDLSDVDGIAYRARNLLTK